MTLTKSCLKKWLADADLDTIIGNSYRDFHAAGFDYMCLHRSDDLTVKAYFFDQQIGSAPEIVNPHNHRYDFSTWCLSGCVVNKRWGHCAAWSPAAERFEKWNYWTPLNHDDDPGYERTKSFSHQSAAFLCSLGETWHKASTSADTYDSLHGDIHTIRIEAPDTVLILEQFADVVALGVPTQTYTRTKEPPSLSGLYNPFTRAEALWRLDQLEALVK